MGGKGNLSAIKPERLPPTKASFKVNQSDYHLSTKGFILKITTLVGGNLSGFKINQRDFKANFNKRVRLSP